MMEHSKIVGGSSAKRVLNCPGSIPLVQKAPPQVESGDATEGSRRHAEISAVLDGGKSEDEKVLAALALLDQVHMDEFDIDVSVNFGKFLPGVFGSADVLGRNGRKGYVIDFKFGDGIAVDAEENEQLMFYAAAALRTVPWFDVDEIECVIIQPPAIKRWTTTADRVRRFEVDLHAAVHDESGKLAMGDWCRFCPAKPTCPLMTGEVERAILTAVQPDVLGAWLDKADILEGWIKDLRTLAMQVAPKQKIPGWKLVQKRAIRKWVNEQQAYEALLAQGFKPSDVVKEELVSPAQAEKLKAKVDGLTAAISSGTTLVPESDPRSEVLQIVHLADALKKLR